MRQPWYCKMKMVFSTKTTLYSGGVSLQSRKSSGLYGSSFLRMLDMTVINIIVIAIIAFLCSLRFQEKIVITAFGMLGVFQNNQCTLDELRLDARVSSADCGFLRSIALIALRPGSIPVLSQLTATCCIVVLLPHEATLNNVFELC